MSSRDGFTAGSVRVWLLEVAADRGLTPSKVRQSRLMGQCLMPEAWAPMVRSGRLIEMILDQIEALTDKVDVEVCLAALNHHRDAGGANLGRRFRELSVLLATHNEKMPVRTLRTRWQRISAGLAEDVFTEIGRRNWQGWRLPDIDAAGSTQLQPFVVDRFEGVHIIDGTGSCTEVVVQQWLTAHPVQVGLASIDHLKIERDHNSRDQAWATEGWLNCSVANSVANSGDTSSELVYFNRPLHEGEKVFVATREKPGRSTSRLISLHVETLGIRSLTIRVQFAVASRPRTVWTYAGVVDPEQKLPPLDLRSTVAVNDVGYVEFQQQNCPAGWFCAIGWD